MCIHGSPYSSYLLVSGCLQEHSSDFSWPCGIYDIHIPDLSRDSCYFKFAVTGFVNKPNLGVFLIRKTIFSLAKPCSTNFISDMADIFDRHFA